MGALAATADSDQRLRYVVQEKTRQMTRS